MDSFDFLVIGGGSAGYNGASTAARLGLKTAVFEGGEDIGGLCIPARLHAEQDAARVSASRGSNQTRSRVRHRCGIPRREPRRKFARGSGG
jgi:thioredoxin reductase